ncbi:NADPH oxidase activator-like [Clytia hemisphaerica]|uniref:Uncharacterized protein n=1 Tax=Clytia hemisphaerica TaxID=252671 RepID=A0A7M5V2G1_9CNID|eukprot:TCONS_00018424-protein
MANAEDVTNWLEAIESFEQNQHEDAILKFQSLTPTAKVMFNIGCCFLSSNDCTRALQKLNHALTMDNHMAIAYFLQGELNFEEKKYAASYKSYDNAHQAMRGKTFIDYRPLGLQHIMHEYQVIGNMLILARKYGIGDGIVHMNEQLQNNEHIQHTMNSIRSGASVSIVKFLPITLFKPNKASIQNVNKKNYLGQAKVVSTENTEEIYSTFSGKKMLEKGPSTPPIAARRPTQAAPDRRPTQTAPNRTPSPRPRRISKHPDSFNSIKGSPPNPSFRPSFSQTPPLTKKAFPIRPAKSMENLDQKPAPKTPPMRPVKPSDRKTSRSVEADLPNRISMIGSPPKKPLQPTFSTPAKPPRPSIPKQDDISSPRLPRNPPPPKPINKAQSLDTTNDNSKANMLERNFSIKEKQLMRVLMGGMGGGSMMGGMGSGPTRKTSCEDTYLAPLEKETPKAPPAKPRPISMHPSSLSNNKPTTNIQMSLSGKPTKVPPGPPGKPSPPTQTKPKPPVLNKFNTNNENNNTPSSPPKPTKKPINNNQPKPFNPKLQNNDNKPNSFNAILDQLNQNSTQPKPFNRPSTNSNKSSSSPPKVFRQAINNNQPQSPKPFKLPNNKPSETKPPIRPPVPQKHSPEAEELYATIDENPTNSYNDNNNNTAKKAPPKPLPVSIEQPSVTEDAIYGNLFMPVSQNKRTAPPKKPLPKLTL